MPFLLFRATRSGGYDKEDPFDGRVRENRAARLRQNKSEPNLKVIGRNDSGGRDRYDDRRTKKKTRGPFDPDTDDEEDSYSRRKPTLNKAKKNIRSKSRNQSDSDDDTAINRRRRRNSFTWDNGRTSRANSADSNASFGRGRRSSFNRRDSPPARGRAGSRLRNYDSDDSADNGYNGRRKASLRRNNYMRDNDSDDDDYGRGGRRGSRNNSPRRGSNFRNSRLLIC